jgi:hypothetical protein
MKTIDNAIENKTDDTTSDTIKDMTKVSVSTRRVFMRPLSAAWLIMLSLFVGSMTFAAPTTWPPGPIARTIPNPLPGDFALFAGSGQINGQALPLSVELRVLALDETKNFFLKRTLTSFGGQLDTREEWLTGDSITTSAKGAEIITLCSIHGGRLELIAVPAGRFQSCHVESQDETTYSEVWVGAVPFGIVRSISRAKDGSVMTDLVLQAYSH